MDGPPAAVAPLDRCRKSDGPPRIDRMLARVIVNGAKGCQSDKRASDVSDPMHAGYCVLCTAHTRAQQEDPRPSAAAERWTIHVSASNRQRGAG